MVDEIARTKLHDLWVHQANVNRLLTDEEIESVEDSKFVCIVPVTEIVRQYIRQGIMDLDILTTLMSTSVFLRATLI